MLIANSNTYQQLLSVEKLYMLLWRLDIDRHRDSVALFIFTHEKRIRNFCTYCEYKNSKCECDPDEYR